MFRIWLLLAASCFFYMFFVPAYIFILFAVILIDYFSGIAIAKQLDRNRKRVFLGISILSNLSILFFFKYFNFFIDNLDLITRHSWSKLNIILPIGLSFHTFQSLSYVLEVYRGKYLPEKRLDVFALYVLFFPQLVAGPIERPQNVIHQLKQFKPFQQELFVNGLKLISIGLIKKCLIADRLSILVDGVYEDITNANSVSVILAVIFFSLQIYYDFSGYTDMALGSAKCFGIDLMRNFNQPYLSQSIKEFWQRWHISLSSWFKEYVYIPLGGNKTSAIKQFRNTMITFALSGLWHGASWNFVVWGACHGVLVYFSTILNVVFSRIIQGLKWMDVVLNFFIVTLLWVFFRAQNFEAVKNVFHSFIHFRFIGLSVLEYNFGPFSFCVLIGALLYLWLINVKTPSNVKVKYESYKVAINFFLVFFLGVFNNQSFIYFQF